MTFSLLLLCVCFILISFNVGESIYSKLRIKKWLLLSIVSLLIVLRLLPNINIGVVEISVANFVLPFILSIFCGARLFEKGKNWIRFLVSILFTTIMFLVYNIIEFNIYETNLLQPYIVLGIILGIATALICRTSKLVFVSNFVGGTLADFITWKFRFGVVQSYNLILGSEMFFCTIFVSFIVATISIYVVRYLKAVKLKRTIKSKNTIG